MYNINFQFSKFQKFYSLNLPRMGPLGRMRPHEANEIGRMDLCHPGILKILMRREPRFEYHKINLIWQTAAIINTHRFVCHIAAGH